MSRPLLCLALVAGLLSGCNVLIPNAIFSCSSDDSCPGGFHCWSDNLCHDSPLPDCVPLTCAQIVSNFAQAGVIVECGSFDDGCSGTTPECGECGPEEECGAGGNAVTCGCIENTCASMGAECGSIPSRCGGDDIPCRSDGAAAGDGCAGVEVCDPQDNQCKCPTGVNCDSFCPGGCMQHEACEESGCQCYPDLACANVECTLPGQQVPLQCTQGGTTTCDCNGPNETCAAVDGAARCVSDCSCEAAQQECGTLQCSGQPCGFCEEYPDVYTCVDGRCSCEDQYENNDTPDDATDICGQDCLGNNWSIGVQEKFEASFSSTQGEIDVDWYQFAVSDSQHPVLLEVQGADSTSADDYIINVMYVCSDGTSGMRWCPMGELDDANGVCSVPGNSATFSGACSVFGGGAEQLAFIVIGVRQVQPTGCSVYQLQVRREGGVIQPPTGF